MNLAFLYPHFYIINWPCSIWEFKRIVALGGFICSAIKIIILLMNIKSHQKRISLIAFGRYVWIRHLRIWLLLTTASRNRTRCIRNFHTSRFRKLNQIEMLFRKINCIWIRCFPLSKLIRLNLNAHHKNKALQFSRMTIQILYKFSINPNKKKIRPKKIRFTMTQTKWVLKKRWKNSH